MANKFTMVVVGALVAGIAAGSAIHAYVPDEALRQSLAGYCQIGTDLFLRLIKMIIAPLVLSTLTVGIAHMGDPARLGRVGVRTLAVVAAWAAVASTVWSGVEYLIAARGMLATPEHVDGDRS
jgi:Na+/H+-dicarboxylate symporter